MPVRRSFNPEPMNRPQIGPHGPSRQPGNLQPAPEPLPPLQPTPQPGAMTGAAPNASASTMGGAPAPMSMGAQLPPSIALRPPTPPQRPTTQSDATVTPMNAHQFLNAQQGTASGPTGGPVDEQSALLKLLATLGHTGTLDAGT